MGGGLGWPVHASTLAGAPRHGADPIPTADPLDHLKAAIDGLLTSRRDDFCVAFAGLADDIADQAAPVDRDWVEDQALAMLARRGRAAPAEA